MSAPENALQRLSRLLTMVPWLVHRQGIDLTAAAAGLGITPVQLENDLQLLFLCGYGQMPDELIDAQWDQGQVFVTNADAISRPLRLGVDEAVTLIVGLRTLRDVSTGEAADTLERALGKLEAAAGRAAEAADRVAVSLEGRDEHLAAAEHALRERRRVHLTYLVPGRDEATERDVDPMRVLGLDGRWYLEGWCHRAQDTRLFRMDRVLELTVLDVDGTPPERAAPRDVGLGAFAPGAGDLTATVHLARAAAWVVDHYPVQSVEELDDGALRVQLATADTAWLVRLVLRLGGNAVIEEPAELATEVRARAAAALAAYQG